MFLDEATASVDARTDAIIQRLVKEEFQDCTVISIAHRIPSVVGSDSNKCLSKAVFNVFLPPLSFVL
jgi:hypothetical protein